MQIRQDTELSYPLETVYEAYRDRLPELPPYLPNLDKVVVLESRREGDVLHLLNEWHARGDIPRVARKFIKPEMLRWKDIAEWHDDGTFVNWSFELAFFRDQVTVGGRNAFVAVGDDRTRIEIRGTLDIDGSNLPGVPRILGRKIAPQIERFVIALIKPNLVKTAEAVGRLLDDS